MCAETETQTETGIVFEKRKSFAIKCKSSSEIVVCRYNDRKKHTHTHIEHLFIKPPTESAWNARVNIFIIINRPQFNSNRPCFPIYFGDNEFNSFFRNTRFGHSNRQKFRWNHIKCLLISVKIHPTWFGFFFKYLRIQWIFLNETFGIRRTKCLYAIRLATTVFLLS